MKTDCYCAALRLAARKVTATYDEALAATNINVAQFSLLRRIERRAPISLTELGVLSGLDRSTIGRNARVLERLGLICDAAGEDGREACVELTPAGARTLRQATPLWRKAQKRIETGIGTGAAESLRDLLLRL